nr:hypothetical protein [Nocardia brasiliensis]
MISMHVTGAKLRTTIGAVDNVANITAGQLIRSVVGMPTTVKAVSVTASSVSINSGR